MLSASNGVDVDLTFSGLEFEEEMIKRATPFQFTTEYNLITCSAEDLIILKSFADRYKDWGDIEGILIRHGKSLDTQYIIDQLTPLCDVKESPQILDKLNELILSLKYD